MAMSVQPHILETERLILQPVQASDIPALVDLWSDPDVTRHMGGPRGRDMLTQNFQETARYPLAETYDSQFSASLRCFFERSKL